MKRAFSPGLFGLLVMLTLTLAACSGQPAMTTWPGLAASGGLAFVAAHQQLYAVNISGANFSSTAWAFPTAPDANIGNFSAAPAIGPNVIVAAADGPTSKYSGAVFGLDPKGQEIWCLALDSKAAQRLTNCPTPADVNSGSGGLTLPFGISLTPPQDDRVTDGVTLVGDAAYFGVNNGKVYAIDALTGKTKWPAPFQAKQAVWAAPVADPDSGLLYVGALDHNLYALDLTSGALKWQKALGAAIAASPALTNGIIYVGTFGSQVLALDAVDGSQKWAITTASWVWGTPVFSDGALYFADVSGNVYAVDAAAGRLIWSVKPGDAIRGAPVVTADSVVIGDRTGKIYRLSRADGAVLLPAPAALKGQLIGSAVLISDTILIAPYSGDNLLVGYSLTGEQKWAFAPTPGK